MTLIYRNIFCLIVAASGISCHGNYEEPIAGSSTSTSTNHTQIWFKPLTVNSSWSAKYDVDTSLPDPSELILRYTNGTSPPICREVMLFNISIMFLLTILSIVVSFCMFQSMFGRCSLCTTVTTTTDLVADSVSSTSSYSQSSNRGRVFNNVTVNYRPSDGQPCKVTLNSRDGNINPSDPSIPSGPVGQGPDSMAPNSQFASDYDKQRYSNYYRYNGRDTDAFGDPSMPWRPNNDFAYDNLPPSQVPFDSRGNLAGYDADPSVRFYSNYNASNPSTTDNSIPGNVDPNNVNFENVALDDVPQTSADQPDFPAMNNPAVTSPIPNDLPSYQEACFPEENPTATSTQPGPQEPTSDVS